MINLHKTKFILLLLALGFSSCKKFLEVEFPATTTTSDDAYGADNSAIAVLTDKLAELSSQNIFLDLGTIGAMFRTGAIQSDELQVGTAALNDQLAIGYYRSSFRNTGNGSFVLPILWESAYGLIFHVNAAIEGLEKSTTLTPSIKNQLLGEAKFLRAFYYFYLVQGYGDVPLILSQDYTVTRLQPRAPKAEVYKQMISDLKEARTLLKEDYPDATMLSTTTEKVRPVKAAADALLARVYLFAGYDGDASAWAAAEAAATDAINSSAASLMPSADIDKVFIKNSAETIWSLQNVVGSIYSNTGEGKLYILTNNGFGVAPQNEAMFYMHDHLYNAFEPGDLRKANWVSSARIDGISYPFIYKYKIGVLETSTNEYAVVLRESEQYLIRAEARALQGKLTGANSAVSDLNIIRARAGLPATGATTLQPMLDAILKERQCELFGEGGHRWFDLKRTGKIDEVMPAVAESRGYTWEPYKALYPIPLSDLEMNPNLRDHQNPGY